MCRAFFVAAGSPVLLVVAPPVEVSLRPHGHRTVGHRAVDEYEDWEAPEKVQIRFAEASCEPCPLRPRCPVRLKRSVGAYVLKEDLAKVNIERRGRARANGESVRRCAVRARIEGTNSGAHGLARLRVRGGLRMRLAVYLKALACNIKRMVRVLLDERAQAARAVIAEGAALAVA